MADNVKPWLLLDVDGPVNAYSAAHNMAKLGLSKHYVEVLISGEILLSDEKTYKEYKKWQPDPAYDFELTDNVYSIKVNPRLGDLFAPYLDVVNLAWATTWLDNANSIISPLVGLPNNLPVVPLDVPLASDKLPVLHHWKLQQIVDWAAGVPFVWFDDEISKRDNKFLRNVLGQHNSRAAIVPAARGLSQRDVDEAISFFSSFGF